MASEGDGLTERRRSETPKEESLHDPQLLRDYPLDTFPNWNINTDDAYYVKAPIDKWGETAFYIRGHITALILSGNTAIMFLQTFRSKNLTTLALAFSQLGLETFFFSLVIFAHWLIDANLGRLLAALLGLCFFVSGSLKVGLCLPRPPIPPTIPLSEENKDWAFPSNHALVGTAYPWFIWLYVQANYDMAIWQSFLLLIVLFTWNVGVAWSRVYLGVHSPCDILGGFTIGMLLFLVFEGFANKLNASFLAAETAYDFSWFVLIPALLLWLHPRAWPETQSYGECVCVFAGASMIWAGRYFKLGSDTAYVSLLEADPDAPLVQYFVRLAVGLFLIMLGRVLMKRIFTGLMAAFYTNLGLKFYSYSSQCKRLDGFQPTKRFTARMRLRPVPGMKQHPPMEQLPWDVDLPVKAFVYSFVGFMVAEGCPAFFQVVGI